MINSNSLKVLGIDVGTAITGWSIVEQGTNRSMYGVHGYGVITTSKDLPMPIRLKQLADELDTIIKQYKPTHMAVEDLFFFKNAKTVISVGQARGVIIVTGMHNNLEVHGYTPLQVKQALTGYGRADKEQMQKMVKMILGLKEIPKPDDAADALAIAVCHLNSLKDSMIVDKPRIIIPKPKPNQNLAEAIRKAKLKSS